MITVNEFRSTLPLVHKSFRAVRKDGESDWDIKDGGRIFGSIIEVDSKLSVRFALVGRKYQFSALQIQEAIDDIAAYILLPKKLGELDAELERLEAGGKWCREISIYAGTGLDPDLLKVQLVRNNRKNHAALTALYLIAESAIN